MEFASHDLGGFPETDLQDEAAEFACCAIDRIDSDGGVSWVRLGVFLYGGGKVSQIGGSESDFVVRDFLQV